MLDIEFQPQMQRLIEVFGKNNFSSERLKIIFKAISEIDLRSFKFLIDDFISKSRQAPLPHEFVEAVWKLKQRNFNQLTQIAASKWETENFCGLKKYLESIGAISLTDAIDMAKINIKNGGSGLPEIEGKIWN